MYASETVTLLSVILPISATSLDLFVAFLTSFPNVLLVYRIGRLFQA
jgi:hypothetical protein